MPREIIEAFADRASIEQDFHDVKEVWGAGQQQVRCLHRVSKNPSNKNKTRIMAVVLHPHDAKDIVIPVKKKD